MGLGDPKFSREPNGIFGNAEPDGTCQYVRSDHTYFVMMNILLKNASLLLRTPI